MTDTSVANGTTDPSTVKKVRKAAAKKGAKKKAAKKAAKKTATKGTGPVHHGVMVGTKYYPSVFMAFTELKLPIGSHQSFRKKLKASGAETFEDGKKKYNFKLVPKKKKEP